MPSRVIRIDDEVATELRRRRTVYGTRTPNDVIRLALGLAVENEAMFRRKRLDRADADGVARRYDGEGRDLVHIDAAAREYRIHLTTLYRKVRDGRLTAYSTALDPRRTYLDRAELLAEVNPDAHISARPPTEAQP